MDLLDLKQEIQIQIQIMDLLSTDAKMRRALAR
jgi:hypothetical protein